jgi:AcrR family transcriptional regulator
VKDHRAYRMSKRAEDIAATRLRIVEAAVHLHGTVGPAATTVSALAEAAGVTRLTVYRHFPDDASLLAACGAHWAAGQTLPDPDAWAAVADPAERLRFALADLYRFYRAGREMLTRVDRDRDSLPEAMRTAADREEAARRDLLVKPFGLRGANRRRARALIGHATSFSTWHSLCLGQGLTDDEAVQVMVSAVLATAEPPA